MSNSLHNRFDFIDNPLLRQNLNEIFKDAVDLLSLSDHYPERVQMNLRRAVLMYTASIVEALVHYIVEKGVKPLEYEDEEWSYNDGLHVCHTFEDNQGRDIQIICGKRLKKRHKITKSTQFKPILKIALENKLISPSLHEKVNKVRELRNRIHLAGLEALEKDYPQETLDKVFQVAREVTEVAEARSR